VLGARHAEPDACRYPGTDSTGALTDVWRERHEPVSQHRGLPVFSPTPSQTLAYLADMQESGVPSTYGYISTYTSARPAQQQLHDGLGRRTRESRSARATAAYVSNATALMRRRGFLSTGRRTASQTGEHGVRHQRRGDTARRVQRRPSSQPTPAAAKESRRLPLSNGQIGSFRQSQGRSRRPRATTPRLTVEPPAPRSTYTVNRPRTTLRSGSSNATPRR